MIEYPIAKIWKWSCTNSSVYSKVYLGNCRKKTKNLSPNNRAKFDIQIKGFANTKPDVLCNRPCKKKGKAKPLQALCGPEGGYCSMTAALEGGEWSAARPGRNLPPGNTRYPFYRRMDGPQGRSGRAENSRPHRYSIPDRPAHSQSLCQLSYPTHN